MTENQELWDHQETPELPVLRVTEERLDPPALPVRTVPLD